MVVVQVMGLIGGRHVRSADGPWFWGGSRRIPIRGRMGLRNRIVPERSRGRSVREGSGTLSRGEEKEQRQSISGSFPHYTRNSSMPGRNLRWRNGRESLRSLLKTLLHGARIIVGDFKKIMPGV